MVYTDRMQVGLREALDTSIEGLRREISGLRTGRASVALVENLEVDYYGTPTPLKAIAAISNPAPRELVIQPWDKNATQPIERAVQASSLGLNPVSDREVIRLTVPALTEERRRELTKLLSKHAEEARIRVRRIREEAMQEIERRLKAKEVSEDARFREREEVQEAVDETNRIIGAIAETKEKEIMTV